MTDAPAPNGETLRDFLSALVEPWMEVLLLGLSPEILDPARVPSRLSTVRAGGAIPALPFDVVVFRADGNRGDFRDRDLARTLPNLRLGGHVVLVALDPATPSFAGFEMEGVPGLAVSGSRTLGDQARVVLASRTEAGGLDLVGLRRHLTALDGHVGRVEELLRDVRSRDAAVRPFDGQWSIKEWIGHLGDLDRDGYLRLLRGADGGDPARAAVNALVVQRDHQARPLAELVCRLRHFRYQSLDVAATLDEAAWRGATVDLDGRAVTRAELVRSWVREEAAVIERIAAAVSGR